MPDLFLYRVWCEVEQMYYEIWSTTPPQVCPNNSAHAIDTTKTTFVDQQLETEKRDPSGRLRVQQSSRPLGTRVHFTSAGDDLNNLADVGGGDRLRFDHAIGDDTTHLVYADFNTIENETYIHEGYLSWKGWNFDDITIEVVPRIVTTVAGTNTDYYVNPSTPYIVLPSVMAGGAGNVTINESLEDPITPGLVYIPDAGDPQFGKPPAYWNADWNSTTKKFENISAAPNGDGRYNIFTEEIVFSRFANKLTFVNDGFLRLKTSDTDMVGHGMRVRATINIVGDDHVCSGSCVLTMHREKSC